MIDATLGPVMCPYHDCGASPSNVLETKYFTTEVLHNLLDANEKVSARYCRSCKRSFILRYTFELPEELKEL